jgi:DinB superfamily
VEINRVAPFLDYLDRVHERTRRVILQIPPAELEWSPAPGKFSFGDLVRHLATIERYMYAETVRGRQSAYPGHGRELADGFEPTLAYYDRLHDESRALFAELTDTRLAEKCRTPGASSRADLLDARHARRRDAADLWTDVGRGEGALGVIRAPPIL